MCKNTMMSWKMLKCPLRSTNKRFLLNTLRSTGLQRRTGEPGAGHSTARGRLRSDSPDRGSADFAQNELHETLSFCYTCKRGQFSHDAFSC
uniref:Uncharacterized protein n=1 Tax=Oreochromis aureus TaxID=47969 RepID=A0A668SY05_OREAU